MVVGVGSALLWRAAGLHESVYEGMPGILAGLAVFGACHALRLHGRERGDEASRA